MLLRYSLLLYPGGVKEQIRTSNNKEIVWLSDRKGFIKLAIKHGASLIPCYSFGVSKVWTYFNERLFTFRDWLRRTFSIGIPLFIGYGFIPYSAPIYTICGEPIHVDKVKNPTQEQIDQLHSVYVQKLYELYEKYKAEYGYANKELIVL